jgi:hypothetical protein
VGVFARVLAEELQRHAEYGGNLGIVGLVLDEVGDQPDIRGDLDAVQEISGLSGPITRPALAAGRSLLRLRAGR